MTVYLEISIDKHKHISECHYIETNISIQMQRERKTPHPPTDIFAFLQSWRPPCETVITWLTWVPSSIFVISVLNFYILLLLHFYSLYFLFYLKISLSYFHFRHFHTIYYSQFAFLSSWMATGLQNALCGLDRSSRPTDQPTLPVTQLAFPNSSTLPHPRHFYCVTRFHNDNNNKHNYRNNDNNIQPWHRLNLWTKNGRHITIRKEKGKENKRRRRKRKWREEKPSWLWRRLGIVK